MPDVPEIGDERHSLLHEGGGLFIERNIFAEGGSSSFYREATKDFITVGGKWVRVQRFGPFDTREDARLFMVARLPVDRDPDGQRLYNLLALFDTRDGSLLADTVRAAREGWERSHPDMGPEDGAWGEFDALFDRYRAGGMVS